ncbi:MAG: polysaccharide pyruvyl transferase family protein [Telluria sp.]
MKLYYYQDPAGNFGDDLNPWLWYSLAPELFDDDSSALLLGIGTLINSKVPALPRKLVFGSGVGYNAAPTIDDAWKFYCVRGPLSASALGLDPSLAMTDPALLVTQLMPAAPVERSAMVSFMPHHASLRFADWKGICDAAGINFIHPAANIHEIIFQIRRSRLVIAEAMHLAIVADAFRTPWIPVACYDHILRFKWDDWCQSMGLAYQPHQFQRVWDMDRMLSPRDLFKTQLKRKLKGAGVWSAAWGEPVPLPNMAALGDQMAAEMRKLATSARSYLSTDVRHRQATEQLVGKLDELRRDARAGSLHVN